MNNTHNNLFGILLSLLSYLCIALIGTFCKAIYNVPTINLLFFQFIISFILTVPWVIKNGSLKIKASGSSFLLTIRCLSGIGSLCAFFISLKFIHLVDSVVLRNTFPIFVPLIALAWAKKNILVIQYIGIIAGFIGIALILKPTLFSINWGALIGLSSGILAAFSIYSLRLLKINETTNLILFYFFLFGILILFPFAFNKLQAFHVKDFLIITLVGILLYLSQVFIAQSLSIIDTVIAASFSYFTVAFAGVLEWLIWSYIPGKTAFVGIGLIIISGIIILMMDNKKTDLSR